MIRFLASQQVKGILIIPVWPYSIWFNFFFPDGCHCGQWVTKMLIFSPNFEANLNSSPCFANIVSYKAVALEFDLKKYNLNQKLKKEFGFLYKSRVRVMLNILYFMSFKLTKTCIFVGRWKSCYLSKRN